MYCIGFDNYHQQYDSTDGDMPIQQQCMFSYRTLCTEWRITFRWKLQRYRC